MGSLTDAEKAFLKASEAKKRESSVLARIRSMLGFFALAAAFEAIVIIMLLIVLIVR